MSGILIFKMFILPYAVVNALLLIIKGNQGRVKNYFLGWSFLCYSLYFLVFIVWYEMGFILSYPNLMRTGSPLGFLAAPFFYLFIRNNSYGWTGFQKWDWVHFLPALIHVFELIPFFTLSVREKLAIAEQVLINPNQLDNLSRGMINPDVINTSKLVLMFIYFGYSCYLVIRVKSPRLINLKQSWAKNWFLLSLGLIGGVNFGYFIYRIAFFTENTGVIELPDLQIYASYFILACVGSLSLYIQFNPDQVFQSIGEMENKSLDLGDADSKEGIIETNYSECEIQLDESVRAEIISLFEDEKIFRQKGLLVADFAKKAGVPVRDLPLYFRHYFDSDFKTMANDYRVCLARKMIEEGYLDDFTLEALGEHCGFSSRTTFYNSFKKKYVKSPSDYWKIFQENKK